MKMTKRCGTTAAGLLLAAALLLAGCEEAVEKPLNGNGPAPAPEAPDDTPRPPKTKPTDPKPAHRATGVELNTKLEWSAASGATSYQVYFGMDTTPDELKGNPVETTFDPGKLEHDTIYYWRVDSKNKIGTITGAVWWFRTEPTPDPQAGEGDHSLPGSRGHRYKPRYNPRMERRRWRDELLRVLRYCCIA